MTDAHTLPSRRDRLTAFVRLKIQNRWLRLALVIALAAAIALAVAVAQAPEPRTKVKLGKGMAGVDVTLSGYRGDMPEPIVSATASAIDTIVSNTSELVGLGEASYYGDRFAGRATASGEVFDPREMTAAHRTLPLGSHVQVTEPRSGRSVVVRINDRGPYHGSRVIDLSEAAARRLGMLSRGTARVQLNLLLT